MSVLLSVGKTNKDLYRRNWTDLLFNEREIPNGGAVRWKNVFEFGGGSQVHHSPETET